MTIAIGLFAAVMAWTMYELTGSVTATVAFAIASAVLLYQDWKQHRRQP